MSEMMMDKRNTTPKDPAFAEELRKVLALLNEKEAGRLNGMLVENLTVVDCSREEMYAEYLFRPEDWCRNQYQGIHGGSIASLFDTAMGLTSAVYVGNVAMSTCAMQLSFLRAMMGDTYLLRIRLTHVGRRIINLYGEMIDAESGKACANCLGTFSILSSTPGGMRL